MIGSLTLSGGENGRPWRLACGVVVDAGQLCVGLTPHEAVARVSSLFSLCGTAHAIAATRALGLSEMDAARQDGMRLEIMRDHALALLLEWPRWLGLPPARDLLARLTHLKAHDPAACAGLRRELTGTSADIAGFDLPGLGQWLESAREPHAPVLVTLLAWLRERLCADWGRVSLPPLQAGDIEAAFGAGHDAPPTPRDAGILPDHMDIPVIRALIGVEGVSLFVRLMARVVDLLACLHPTSQALFSRAAALSPHLPGIGVARAARGIVAHRAVVRQGRVAQYAILSPTFWHVAPGGLLPRIAAGLPVDGPRRPWLARLMLSCVNPCVPVAVEEG